MHNTQPIEAEILSIGTELLLGQTINTDAATIAQALASLGIQLHHVQTVGDNHKRLAESLQLALTRSSLVLTTGGLGPTEDDLSKEVVAQVSGCPLELHQEALATLKGHFPTESALQSQISQAYYPKGAHLLANSKGTAQGCAVQTKNGQWICMLPGPPSELIPMLENELIPFLQKTFPCQTITSRFIRVFGLGEGLCAQKLGDLVDASDPTVATYAGDCEVAVRVTTQAATKEEAHARMEPTISRIQELLGDVVYGIDVQSLEEVVVQKLRSQKRTLAIAESCTGGLVAKRITDQPGASEVFGYGFVTYANAAKTNLLGVSQEILKAHGAVSRQTALAMAEGARKVAESDFALALTGIAGPDGGTPQKPVGLVYIALATKEQTFLRKLTPTRYLNTRPRIRINSANHALDMLRRALFHLPIQADWAPDR